MSARRTRSDTGRWTRRVDLSGPAQAYAHIRVNRLNRIDPGMTQQALLRRLVRRARTTRFGQSHTFSEISDVASYQQRVPVRRYAEFWTDWWQPSFPDLTDVTWPGRIPFFAMTSGTTTGRSKFIPYTRQMRRAAARGFLDLLCFHFVNRPSSRLLGGLALALTGPTELAPQHEPAVRTGSVSAITAGALPGFLRGRVLPPPSIANLPEWKDKISRLADIARGRDIRFLGGSPNWLLIFLGEVARQAPHSAERVADWFPNLELVVHGGLNFAPYRARFETLLRGSHAETREMYSASEGVFAIADRGDGDGMRLHLDGSVFFEFIPVETLSSGAPVRHWIANAETGVDYALAISTAAGLWSYLVGDVVRLVDTAPPRLIVVGRVQNSLSAYGEHLIEAEIAEAVASAAGKAGLSVLDYCVGVEREKTGGHHVYLVETTPPPTPQETALMATQIDRRLCALNEDYAELRQNDMAMRAPQVRPVPPGGFVRWMRLRRDLGGQNKVPRIVTDDDLFADIRAIALAAGQSGAGNGG